MFTEKILLVLIKQKPKKIKNTKKYLNETMLENQEREKLACANIFLELPLTNYFRHYLGMHVTSYY